MIDRPIPFQFISTLFKTISCQVSENSFSFSSCNSSNSKTQQRLNYSAQHHLLWRLGIGAALCVLSACQSPQRFKANRSIPPTPPITPTVAPVVPKPSPTTTPTAITVTVDSPIDLKVKLGDFVKQGQVISDREVTRLTLEQQKESLLSRKKALASPAGVTLNTKAEEELVAIATQQVESAKTVINQYNSETPWTDFARENLPLIQEEAKEAQLQRNLDIAQQNLSKAQQKLDTTRRQLQAFKNQQSQALTQIQSQLQQIESKIPQLKPVTAPHSGTISAIQAPQKRLSGQPTKVRITLIPGTQPLSVPTPLSSDPTPVPVTPPGIPTPLAPPDSLPSPTLPVSP